MKIKTIAVDLDGTLAEYHGWKGIEHIGKVIPLMEKRIYDWLSEGHRVFIFTARANDNVAVPFIQVWLHDNGFPPLPITHIKRKDFDEFWDDRAISVVPNEGIAYDTIEKIDHPIIAREPISIEDNAVYEKSPIFDEQVGGEHYKEYKIQPFTFMRENKIPAAEAEVVTHVLRHAQKDGKEDLLKAIHLIQLIIESDYS